MYAFPPARTMGAKRSDTRSARKRPGSAPQAAATRSSTPGASALSGPAPWIALGLIALTVLVFEPARTFGFLPWDDPHYVYRNPQVLGGLSLDGIRWAFTAGSPYWHPLTWLSLMLDVELFGPSPGAMHVVGVAMHALSGILLFLFFHRVTSAPWKSAFVAAVFAVHPLRVESVVWIAERKDVLPVLCMMIALHAYVWYTRRPSAVRYLVVTLPIALGLLAKPTLVILPLVLLLVDLWPLGRVPGLAGASRVFSPEIRRSVLRLVTEKLPWLALALAAVAFNLALHQQQLATFENVPLSLRMSNAVTYYLKYIVSMLWPTGLSPLHPFPRVMPPLWLLASAVALIIGASVVAVRTVRQRPYVTFGWFWYVGSLLPVIALGLVQAGDQGMADRFGYIPFIGLYAILAWGVPDIAARRSWNWLRPLVPVSAVLIVMASAAATRQYVWVWRDGVTLWTHAVAVDPTSHRAHANLGDALMLARQYPAALREFREAARLAPQVPEYQRQVGEALVRNGQPEEALAVFEAELARLPARAANGSAPNANTDRVWTLNQRGLALAKLGRHADAIATLTEAVRLDPSSAVSHSNLCVVLGGSGRYDEGRRECQEAIRLNPLSADAHGNLGAIALGKGDAAGAVSGFTEALRLDSLSGGRHLKLGAALARLGRMEEARQAFADAVRLDPHDAEAHNALGAVLAELKRDREAIVAFTEAVRLQPGLTHAYANRGLSLATLGDFHAAILDYQQILRIDPDNAGARSAVDALQRKLAGR